MIHTAFAACGFAVFTHFFFPCIALPESFSSSLLLSASLFSMYSANASDPSSRIFSRISPGPDRKLSTLRYPAALAGNRHVVFLLEILEIQPCRRHAHLAVKDFRNSAESSVFSNMRPRTPTALSPSAPAHMGGTPLDQHHRHALSDGSRNTSCPFSSRLMGPDRSGVHRESFSCSRSSARNPAHHTLFQAENKCRDTALINAKWNLSWIFEKDMKKAPCRVLFFYKMII